MELMESAKPHDSHQERGEGCSWERWGWMKEATVSNGLKPEKLYCV